MRKIIFICLALFAAETVHAQATSSSGMAQTMGYASSAVGMGMGGYMIKTNCNQPGGAMGCMMGVMAVMQGMTTLASSTGDGSTAASTTDCTDSTFCAAGSGTGSTTTGGTTTGGAGTGGGFSNLTPEAQQAANQLSQLGYNYNPSANTVTTPTGTYPASAFSSGANLASIGAVTPDQGAAIDKAIKDALANYKMVSMPIAGGGGGAAAGGGVKIEYDDGVLGGKRKGLAMGKGRTAGLTRTLASGEAIGAQVDDIFRMVTEKYQEKKKGNEFIP